MGIFLPSNSRVLCLFFGASSGIRFRTLLFIIFNWKILKSAHWADIKV